jgi:hypothetical protein
MTRYSHHRFRSAVGVEGTCRRFSSSRQPPTTEVSMYMRRLLISRTGAHTFPPSRGQPKPVRRRVSSRFSDALIGRIDSNEKTLWNWGAAAWVGPPPGAAPNPRLNDLHVASHFADTLAAPAEPQNKGRIRVRPKALSSLAEDLGLSCFLDKLASFPKNVGLNHGGGLHEGKTGG